MLEVSVVVRCVVEYCGKNSVAVVVAPALCWQQVDSQLESGVTGSVPNFEGGVTCSRRPAVKINGL